MGERCEIQELLGPGGMVSLGACDHRAELRLLLQKAFPLHGLQGLVPGQPEVRMVRSETWLFLWL